MLNHEVYPYLPSARLCRLWMQGRLAGLDDSQAWRQARLQAGLPPREMARTLCAGAHGQQPLVLSVAIEGGSSVVKKVHPEHWLLSGHGRWQAIHFGALEAAYASTPWWRHFSPDLHRILLESSPSTPFHQLSERLFNLLKESMDIETILPILREARGEKRELIEEVVNENKDIQDANLTIFDVIFRKGPDAIWNLL